MREKDDPRAVSDDPGSLADDPCGTSNDQCAASTRSCTASDGSRVGESKPCGGADGSRATKDGSRNPKNVPCSRSDDIHTHSNRPCDELNRPRGHSDPRADRKPTVRGRFWLCAHTRAIFQDNARPSRLDWCPQPLLSLLKKPQCRHRPSHSSRWNTEQIARHPRGDNAAAARR